MDDEEVIASTLKEFLQGEGFEVATARDLASALAQVEVLEPEIVLCDVQLPGADGLTVLDRVLEIRPETLFIMITAYATVENAVAAFQRGAHDYLMKPVLFEDLLAKIGRLIAFSPAAPGEPGTAARSCTPRAISTALVGDSPPIQAVKTLIRKVGPTRTTVLITGESGTGKELVARALHALGPGRDEHVSGDQLRGHPARSAGKPALRPRSRARSPGPIATTPGCSSRPGGGRCSSTRSASCRRSTQAKLLRAIENKEVLPVGATRPVSFQARLLTATNKDLAAEVAAGPVPRRSLLSSERGVDPSAAACATAARISPTWCPPCWPSTPGAWASASTASTTPRSGA